MIWTAYPVDVECGACSQRIPAGAPVAIKAGKLKRCSTCEPAVNEAEVDAARQALEAEALAPVKVSAYRPTYTRVAPHRPPTSFSKLSDAASAAFDPKMAALGRDDR